MHTLSLPPQKPLQIQGVTAQSGCVVATTHAAHSAHTQTKVMVSRDAKSRLTTARKCDMLRAAYRLRRSTQRSTDDSCGTQRATRTIRFPHDSSLADRTGAASNAGVVGWLYMAYNERPGGRAQTRKPRLPQGSRGAWRGARYLVRLEPRTDWALSAASSATLSKV